MQRALLLLAALVTPAFGQGTSEDFSTGNPHGWARDFATPATYFATGGNPGGMIQTTFASSQAVLFAPVLVPTTAGHPWSGDFITRGVSAFSYDREVVTGSSNFGTHIFLVVGFDNGTPTNLLDDTFLLTATGDVFQFGSSPWQTHSVAIPSASLVVPPGWSVAHAPNSPSAGVPDDDTWQTVMAGVSYVGIAADRIWGGTAWFGNHIINFDNLVLTDNSNTVGTPFCSPADNNSTGSPAVLTGSMTAPGGSTLHLEVQGGPSSEFCYALVGDGISDPGMPVGAGHLCLAIAPSVIGRYNVIGGSLNSVGQFDGSGTYVNLVGTSSVGTGFDVPATVPVPGSPTITAGSTWNFQVWYRDGAAGVGQSNLTNGLSVTF